MAKMKRAKNGWFLETEDGVIVYQEPINEASFENDEVERFADFLRAIDIEFGPSTSRYSPKRIRIVVEPGDKYEDQGT